MWSIARIKSPPPTVTAAHTTSRTSREMRAHRRSLSFLNEQYGFDGMSESLARLDRLFFGSGLSLMSCFRFAKKKAARNLGGFSGLVSGMGPLTLNLDVPWARGCNVPFHWGGVKYLYARTVQACWSKLYVSATLAPSSRRTSCDGTCQWSESCGTRISLMGSLRWSAC